MYGNSEVATQAECKHSSPSASLGTSRLAGVGEEGPGTPCPLLSSRMQFIAEGIGASELERPKSSSCRNNTYITAGRSSAEGAELALSALPSMASALTLDSHLPQLPTARAPLRQKARDFHSPLAPPRLISCMCCEAGKRLRLSGFPASAAVSPGAVNLFGGRTGTCSMCGSTLSNGVSRNRPVNYAVQG